MLWELVSGEEAWLGLSNEDIIATVVQQKTQLKFMYWHPPAYKVRSACLLSPHSCLSGPCNAAFCFPLLRFFPAFDLLPIAFCPMASAQHMPASGHAQHVCCCSMACCNFCCLSLPSRPLCVHVSSVSKQAELQQAATLPLPCHCWSVDATLSHCTITTIKCA